MASSSKQNSRFSTLNVFKFAGASKPPPLPPKDPYYLANPSLSSLSATLTPDSQPTTPLFSQYGTSMRSPSPSPSYAPAHHALSPSALSPESAGFRKGLFNFGALGKRPKTPKSAKSVKSAVSDDMPPPEPVDDPSISLPWNFQHNHHVDESLSGLPPTWSASLTDMGFSDEEIAAISARRASGRSPSLHPIGSIRSVSPSSSLNSTNISYNPRASSLRRDLSDTSMSGRSRSGSTTTLPRNTSKQYSELSTSDHSMDFVHIDGRSNVRPPETISRASSRAPSPLPSSSTSRSSGKDAPPRTPPKRTYHVTNDSVSTISSPPPAYRSSPNALNLSNVEEDLVLPELTASTSTLDASSEAAVSRPRKEVGPSIPALSRLSALPPRLSIHRDTLGDLSSWSESLFSIASDSQSLEPVRESGSQTVSVAPKSRSRSGTSSRFRDAERSAASASASASASTSSSTFSTRPQSGQRKIPPQKPAPLHQLPMQKASLAPSVSGPSAAVSVSSANSASTLWNEVMGLVNGPDAGPSSGGPSPSAISSLASPDSIASNSEPITPGDRDELKVTPTREKENRDSNMSTMTVTPATIVHGVSVATRARANVVAAEPVKSNGDDSPTVSVFSAEATGTDGDHSSSSHSSESRSSVSSVAMSMSTFGTGSGSGSSPNSRPVTLTNAAAQQWKSSAKSNGLLPYVNSSPAPSPRAAGFDHSAIYPPAERAMAMRPTIIIDDFPSHAGADCKDKSPLSVVPSPLTPSPRYPGWVSKVVAPLREFIDDKADPRELFTDLQEIAEGDSGSVFAARALDSAAADEDEDEDEETTSLVAIKHVMLVPDDDSSKLLDLQRELTLMRRARHPHILRMEAVYMDLVEDLLWIRMELMDRSLADVINLTGEGLVVQEKPIAQFASDVLLALSYLQKLGIAHRDVRSDNLLINKDGVVKIADFSHAVKVKPTNPMRSDPAGVLYWQAPEMRTGSYDALKVDVWSLGATIWEMAEAEPPFSDCDISKPRLLPDRWPPLSQPEIYSRSFHDFLRQCSEPSSSRPDPDDLLNTPFIRNAKGRAAIIKLLSQCRSIEERLSKRQSSGDSEGTVSMS